MSGCALDMIPDDEVQCNPDTYVGNCGFSFALCKCEDQLALMAMRGHRYSQAAWSSGLGEKREGARAGWELVASPLFFIRLTPSSPQ